MPNSVAIALAALILGALALDGMLNGFEGTLSLARRGLDLIDHLAFWR
jgi:hypothetical protein